MRHGIRAAIALACLCAVPSLLAQHQHAEHDAAKHVSDRAPVLEHIGNLHHKVSTRSKLAQKYFDQGLTMAYAFNHLESERSFRSAAAEDPKLAIAWWGVALALGPNINDNITPEREAQAKEAIDHAVKLRAHASRAEKDLIDALVLRYGAKDQSERPKFDQDYYAAMKRLSKKYPNDPDVGALYAESALDLSPWNYYDEKGEANPAVTEAIVELERVMKRWPEHPGANHIYIHAVEASPHPERAVVAAQHLGPFAPAAGHLVHMPSHIWVRVGNWDDAVVANEKASKADEDYIAQCHAQGIYPMGYYPHNLHMLMFAAMMEGRSAEALEAGNKAASRFPEEMKKDPMNFVSQFTVQPYNAMVRFGKWDEILAIPKPEETKGYIEGMWHYARSMAFTRKGQLKESAEELAALDALTEKKELADYGVMINTAHNLLAVARGIAAGELALAKGDNEGALAEFKAAVSAQDGLRYDEPESWTYPARHYLGNAQLKAGDAAGAEATFREDLKRHPGNGWSLFGLEQSLRAQDKNDEADQVQKNFDKAWSRADVKLTAAVF